MGLFNGLNFGLNAIGGMGGQHKGGDGGQTTGYGSLCGHVGGGFFGQLSGHLVGQYDTPKGTKFISFLLESLLYSL